MKNLLNLPAIVTIHDHAIERFKEALETLSPEPVTTKGIGYKQSVIGDEIVVLCYTGSKPKAEVVEKLLQEAKLTGDYRYEQSIYR